MLFSSVHLVFPLSFLNAAHFHGAGCGSRLLRSPGLSSVLGQVCAHLQPAKETAIVCKKENDIQSETEMETLSLRLTTIAINNFNVRCIRWESSPMRSPVTAQL